MFIKIYRIYFERNIMLEGTLRRSNYKNLELKNLTLALGNSNLSFSKEKKRKRKKECTIYLADDSLEKCSFTDDSFGVSTPEHDNVVGHAQAKDVSAEESNGRVPRWSHRCLHFLNTCLIRRIFENSILGISLYDPPFFLNAVKKTKE